MVGFGLFGGECRCIELGIRVLVVGRLDLGLIFLNEFRVGVRVFVIFRNLNIWFGLGGVLGFVDVFFTWFLVFG